MKTNYDKVIVVRNEQGEITQVVIQDEQSRSIKMFDCVPSKMETYFALLNQDNKTTNELAQLINNK